MGDSTGRRIVWIDTVDPDDALARTGAKMGRLAEMARGGEEQSRTKGIFTRSLGRF